MEAPKLEAPLLRNDQVEELEGEKSTMENSLRNPNFKGDRGEVGKQLRRLNDQLETQRPRAYGSQEIDGAVRREAQLRSEIKQGMLSQEEMRKNPPGAVDRHRAWEKRNMPKIEEWQNIQRRLNAGNDDRESASIEQFRPTANSMNMDNAQIPGKLIYLPPAGAGAAVVFTDEQLAALRAHSPELADKMASLSNPQRQEVKDVLTGIGLSEPSQASIDGKRGVEKREAAKRVMSQEHKDKMKAGREAAKAKKAA